MPKIFVKKITKVFRNGRLVQTMENKMTEAQYNKDLAERLLEANVLHSRKANVKRSQSVGTKIDRMEEKATDANTGNRYRYVSTYYYPERRVKKAKR